VVQYLDRWQDRDTGGGEPASYLSLLSLQQVSYVILVFAYNAQTGRVIEDVREPRET
jgi:hypothetical protein